MSEVFQARLNAVVDAFNTGNVDGLDEFYVPNFVRHPMSGPDIEGLEAIKAGIKNTRLLTPDLKFTAEEMLVDGDKTSTWWIMEGTNTGSSPDNPIPPTGKAWTMRGCSMMRHENGMAVEEWVYSDSLGAYQQMGLLPSNEEIIAQNS